MVLFVSRISAWVGKDGYPLSWAHYRMGIEHLNRERVRETQRLARAMRIARNPADAYEKWDLLHDVAGE